MADASHANQFKWWKHYIFYFYGPGHAVCYLDFYVTPYTYLLQLCLNDVIYACKTKDDLHNISTVDTVEILDLCSALQTTLQYRPIGTVKYKPVLSVPII